MSRCLAACLALLTIAAADAGPLPHASGRPDGPGPRCGGGFTPARGDTLYSIARRCGVSAADLGLADPAKIEAGERIDLGIEVSTGPRDLGLLVPRPPPPRGVVRPLPPMAPPPPRARPDRHGPPAPPPPPQAEGAIYHFQAGDTLYSLARWARVSLPALLAANPDVAARDIEIGDPIRLPRGAVRPEPMRMRERGRPAPVAAMSPPPQPPAMVPMPPRPLRAPPVTTRPPAPPAAGKPEADEDEDDEVTPGGMDNGEPEPDGM